jgi:hypothetical protein
MDAASSLLEVFQNSQLVDGRRRQGLRHPLASILALTTVATLCGIRTQAAVVDFARARGRAFLRLLGFRKFHPPSTATLSRVFRTLDVVTFEACIRDWVAARVRSQRYEHIAIDGKTLRGSRDRELPAIHLLAAYATEIETTLAQLRVDASTNEHKAALELLGVLPLKGKTVTADAMFTHRDFCNKVRERGGHFVLPVKENQATLRRDIHAVFSDPPAGLSPPTEAVARGQL